MIDVGGQAGEGVSNSDAQCKIIYILSLDYQPTSIHVRLLSLWKLGLFFFFPVCLDGKLTVENLLFLFISFWVMMMFMCLFSTVIAVKYGGVFFHGNG